MSLTESQPFLQRECLFTMTQEPSSRSVVCEAAPHKKADSAAKRAHQADKRRFFFQYDDKRRNYNNAKKSEVKTQMKKVLEALDMLRKKPDAQTEEIFPIEKQMLRPIQD